ncbi:MAG: hypothetical protein KGJ13_10320, partial [Patescibacteria group bacterium]|nr:hypothetical protein [Patescibacteria group bacterium]
PMTCKRGHNAKRDSKGECCQCIKERRINNGYYSVSKTTDAENRAARAVVLPVADFGFIKAPTKAQLMARR